MKPGQARNITFPQYIEEVLRKAKKTPKDVDCILAKADGQCFVMESWEEFVKLTKWVRIDETGSALTTDREWREVCIVTQDLVETFKFVGQGWWLERNELVGLLWEYMEFPTIPQQVGALENLLNYHRQIQIPPQHSPYDPSKIYPVPEPTAQT